MLGDAETTLHQLDVERMLREAPPAPLGGVVYFAEAVDTPYIKVGWAKHDPAQGSLWSAALRRIADLQTGCPYKLRLVGVIEGTQADERAWHEALAVIRHRGEWFDCAETQVHPSRGYIVRRRHPRVVRIRRRD